MSWPPSLPPCTRAACRSPSHPVCCPEGARPVCPSVQAPGPGVREPLCCVGTQTVWGTEKIHTLPLLQTPAPPGTQKVLSTYHWVGRCPQQPLGSGCVFSLGIPQECKETDTAMGGVFTALSMPFLLWEPRLYSQWYSSPTQYFYV